jgi:hypothetical protein
MRSATDLLHINSGLTRRHCKKKKKKKKKRKKERKKGKKEKKEREPADPEREPSTLSIRRTVEERKC